MCTRMFCQVETALAGTSSRILRSRCFLLARCADPDIERQHRYPTWNTPKWITHRYHGLLSSAGFLKAPCKFNERQFDGIADCLEFEHVDLSFALFILADTRLSHSKDCRQLCLG